MIQSICRDLVALVLALALPLSAHAQRTPVYQSGTMVAGDAVKSATNGTVTDSKSTAITADGHTIAGISQSSSAATAHHIWTCAIGACDNAAAKGNYDAVRGVAVSPNGQLTEIVSAVSGYLLNQTSRAGPPYQSFPVSAVLNGIGICDADGCGTWGINTIVTDNQGQSVSLHGPRFIFGAEFDVQATSTNTRVSGVSTGGTSLVQPAFADGFSCLYLDGAAAAGSIAKWSGCYQSQNGSATAFAIVGAKQSSGAGISSQNIDFNFFDSSGTERKLSLAATPGGMLLATTGAAAAASIALPAGAVYNVGDTGGYQINSRTIAVGNGATLAMGSNSDWTTVNIGNAVGALVLRGTSVTMSEGAVVPNVKAVAALPTCNAASKYHTYAVSDANAPSYGATLSGGGAVATLAMCNGTNWTAH